MIWKYVGPPLTGWKILDNTPATVAIVADGGTLYQLHNTVHKKVRDAAKTKIEKFIAEHPEYV